MWPFSKKRKLPKVPFPEARPLEAGSLRFPRHAPPEKVIEPERIKEAAGIKEPTPLSDDVIPEMEVPLPQSPEMPRKEASAPLPSFQPEVSEPLFIRKEVYQRILGELENLKGDLMNLNDLNTDLENSEYNEENYFTKLRRSVKAVHDRLLQVDKTVFKS